MTSVLRPSIQLWGHKVHSRNFNVGIFSKTMYLSEIFQTAWWSSIEVLHFHTSFGDLDLMSLSQLIVRPNDKLIIVFSWHLSEQVQTYYACLNVSYIDDKIIHRHHASWLWCVFKEHNDVFPVLAETLMVCFFLEIIYVNEVCWTLYDNILHWALQFHASFSDLYWIWRSQQRCKMKPKVIVFLKMLCSLEVKLCMDILLHIWGHDREHNALK